jgi:hypothetical protein
MPIINLLLILYTHSKSKINVIYLLNRGAKVRHLSHMTLLF